MKKIYFIFLALFCLYISDLHAQARNLGIGVAPVGSIQLDYKKNEEKKGHRLNYTSYLNGHLYYEPQLFGASWLIEGSYAQAQIDNFEINEESALTLTPSSINDRISLYSFYLYSGLTIFPQKRLQIPIYGGVGGDYIEGEPIDNFLFSLGAKARIKFYITDQIGLYLGADAKIGIGFGKSKPNLSSSDIQLNSKMWYLNTGLTFSF